MAKKSGKLLEDRRVRIRELLRREQHTLPTLLDRLRSGGFPSLNERTLKDDLKTLDASISTKNGYVTVQPDESDNSAGQEALREILSPRLFSVRKISTLVSVTACDYNEEYSAVNGSVETFV